jgi:rhodanese-related sulfurtransferase
MNNVEQLLVNEVFEIYNSKNDDYVFIDVREPQEWELGVIPGITKISLGDIHSKLDELDKDKKYIIVCRSGQRSNNASRMMLQSGFKDVSNFQGGMLDWYDSDFPIEK